MTTIGLVIHSLAEGIALGASMYLANSDSSTSDMGLVVQLAILIHKAPEAMGFGTFLLHKGANKSQIFWNVFAYSVASPVAALLGYVGLLSVTIDSDQDMLLLDYYVGLAMLVSVGTFLYVTTIHILPEVYSSKSGSHHNHGHHHAGKVDHSNQPKTTAR